MWLRTLSLLGLAAATTARAADDCGPFLLIPPVDPPGPADYSETITVDPLMCLDHPIWAQLPDGANGISSQDDLCYPFLSEFADDFVGTGEMIVGMGWWGTWWCSDHLPVSPFHVRVYLSEADGKPGDLVHAFDIGEDGYDWEGDGVGVSVRTYCTTIEEPILAHHAVRYHLSLIAVFCWAPQWAWMTAEPGEIPAWFRSDHFGYPDWTSSVDVFGIPHDAAFTVFAEPGSTPLLESTWGKVKAHYAVPLAPAF